MTNTILGLLQTQSATYNLNDNAIAPSSSQEERITTAAQTGLTPMLKSVTVKEGSLPDEWSLGNAIEPPQKGLKRSLLRGTMIEVKQAPPSTVLEAAKRQGLLLTKEQLEAERAQLRLAKRRQNQ